MPGIGQSVNNYIDYNGLEIWMKTGLENELDNTDYLIGHSLGASFALVHNKNPNCKFILINPLIHKKNFVILVFRWIKFILFEGFKLKKVVPFKYWFYTFINIFNLVKVDVLSAIKKLPKDNIFIIRGKKDNFFCDNEAVEIMKENGFEFSEIDAGHDWNENIAETVKRYLKNNL